MKFNYKRTILCSLAFGWIALFWGSYDSFMQIVDYEVFNLSSLWHGVIIASDNIFGLILLPIFGKLSDMSKGKRFGKRKPFVVIGTIVEMIAFFGVCVFASLGKDYFVPFILCLMVTLASMAAYRSPALAIVPDINPDKFRSKANAISNIVSVITTVLALLYFMTMPEDVSDGFWTYGGLMVGTTLVLLVAFCITVKETDFNRAVEIELAEERQALIPDGDVAEKIDFAPTENSVEAVLIEEDKPSYNVDTSDTLLHLPNIDATAQHDLSISTVKKLKRKATFNKLCILGIVFCFYMAYNAMTSNFIMYAINIFHFAQGQAMIPLIIAQAAAMLAFPLASWLAGKIGRKYTILIGFILMALSFATGMLFTTPHPVLYIMFMLLGVSFGFAMVNIYPFYLENAPDSKLGKETGVFSVAMTLAMVVTPILSGVLIDNTGHLFGGFENAGFKVLFPYCIVFLILAIVFSLLIEDKNPINKRRKLKKLQREENENVNK